MAWGRSPSLYLLNTKQLLHVRDEKTSGTNGGTFTSGAWRTRDLNTVKTNTISGASLASNQVTLPAGTYWVDATAPACKVERHKAKLYNTTSSTDVVIGTVQYTDNAYFIVTASRVTGLFTLSAQGVLELRHYCGFSVTTQGFGLFGPDSSVEVFSEAMFWKVN